MLTSLNEVRHNYYVAFSPGSTLRSGEGSGRDIIFFELNTQSL